MGSTRKIASGAVWSILYNVLNALYGFVAIPILIKYFGKAEYGLIGLAQSVNVYIQLMDMGFNSTNVRFFSAWLEKKDMPKVGKLFRTSLSFYTVVGLLNAVILLVVSAFSSSIFNVSPEQDVIIKKLLYILSVSAVLNWFSSCFDQLIRATENVDWIQKRSFIPKLLQIVILVLTVTCHFSLILYFILTTFAVFTILPLSISKIRRDLPFISFKPGFDTPVFKEVLPYSLNIFSFDIFKYSFVNLCPVFIGIRACAEMVTDYKVIFGIVSLISIFTGVVMGALLPSTSRAVARDDRGAYEAVAYRGTKYLSFVCCFCAFGLMTISKDLLVLYVGEEYLHLAIWLLVLCFISVSNHILCISSLILSGINIRPLSRMVIISSVSGLVVAWLLIPRFGVGGVVIANIVYEVLQMGFYYLYYIPSTMKLSSIRVFMSFLPSFILGAVLFAILFFMPHSSNNLANIFLYGGAFALIFIVSSWLILGETDREFVKEMLNSYKHV